MWDQTNKKNVPGVQMSVIKIVSPDDIILKSLDHNSAQYVQMITIVSNCSVCSLCKLLAGRGSVIN